MKIEPDHVQDADDRFDALLRAHLADELGPRVGTALDKLDALRAQAADRPGARRLTIGARWSAAAMLMIGLGVAAPFLARQLRPRPGVTPTVDPPLATPDAHDVVADAVVTDWTETYDAGTVLVDPTTPARMLRRVRFEQTDWKDERGQWQSRVVVPSQDVILVDLQKQ